MTTLSLPDVLVTILTPAAMTNTGHIGLVLLLYFTVNGAFVGTRLGLCWLMVEEKFPEFKTNKCRDPYPTIAEKAFGKPGRWFATICIIGVQYGTGVGFLILCAKFADNILMYFDVLHEMTPCWYKNNTAEFQPNTEIFKLFEG